LRPPSKRTRCAPRPLPTSTKGLSKGLIYPPGSQTSYKLDIIGFDACLMAMYEVAAALAPYSKFLLGSELLEPGSGWDYKVLGNVTASAAAGVVVEAADLGQMVVRTYMQTSVQVRSPRALTGAGAGRASRMGVR
jgi:hypothetical protein